MPSVLLIAVASYLLGSIPFGYLLVRFFRGEDVRQSGSGNIGATNVARKSPVLGVVTLVLDALKGSAAIMLASLFSARTIHGTVPAALAALFVIVGHMFPVWLKCRGGKGVATGLGAFVMIAPKAVLIAVGVFVVVVLVFRYVSLGSITAVAAFPFLVWLLHEDGSARLALALMALASLLIVMRHHQNIRRLLGGTENRFRLRRARPESRTESQ